MGRILRTFLAGVLALLPIAVTVFVTAWVGALVASYAGPGSFIGRIITGLGTSLGLDIEPSSTAAYLLGLAIILGAIFLLGLLVEFGAQILHLRQFRLVDDAYPARLQYLRSVEALRRHRRPRRRIKATSRA